MNVCLLAEVDAIVLKASWVGPGSVNDHPPTEIQVSSPAYFVFRAVNLPNKEAESESIGVI